MSSKRGISGGRKTVARPSPAGRARSLAPCLIFCAPLLLVGWSVALADVCWEREVEHIDKKTGKVTYRNRAVPCPEERPGNREGVCWQREIERIDPRTGKVTYRNRATPCRQAP